MRIRYRNWSVEGADLLDWMIVFKSAVPGADADLTWTPSRSLPVAELEVVTRKMVLFGDVRHQMSDWPSFLALYGCMELMRPAAGTSGVPVIDPGIPECSRCTWCRYAQTSSALEMTSGPLLFAI
jgi:hypothetical protein